MQSIFSNKISDFHGANFTQSKVSRGIAWGLAIRQRTLKYTLSHPRLLGANRQSFFPVRNSLCDPSPPQPTRQNTSKIGATRGGKTAQHRLTNRIPPRPRQPGVACPRPQLHILRKGYDRQSSDRQRHHHPRRQTKHGAHAGNQQQPEFWSPQCLPESHRLIIIAHHT